MRNNVIKRVRAEYLVMPGMQLKAEQVQRLCGIEGTTCQVELDLLVDEKFLCVKSDGQYARLTTGHHPHPAKAGLRTNTRAKKAAAVTLAAGIVALMVVILAKRPIDVDERGSVNDQWMAQHRVDSP
jgi:hypothetical protein